MYIKALLFKTPRKLQERRKGRAQGRWKQNNSACCLLEQKALCKGGIEPIPRFQGLSMNGGAREVAKVTSQSSTTN